MIRKRLKWAACLAAPLILFVLPFGYGINFGKYFQKMVLKPQKTGIMTLNFYDEKRERPLTTEVWYPIDSHVPASASSGVWLRCDEARDAPISEKKKQYPLIILSHGHGCDRFNISWLAEVFAANGYIVVAMDHFGNTWNNKIPECYARPWERPKDISFILDQVLSLPFFEGRIDEKRIGFTGYSLGGATGMWIAGAYTNVEDVEKLKSTCIQELAEFVPLEVIEKIDFRQACQSFLDKRISAVFVMAPALGTVFDQSSLEKIQVPVYIVAPEKDTIAPIELNARVFAAKIKSSSLMILQGDATHFVFLNAPTLMGKRFLDAKYWGDPHTIDRQKVQEDVCKVAFEFFSKELSSQ